MVLTVTTSCDGVVAKESVSFAAPDLIVVFLYWVFRGKMILKRTFFEPKNRQIHQIVAGFLVDVCFFSRRLFGVNIIVFINAFKAARKPMHKAHCWTNGGAVTVAVEVITV